MFMAAPTDLSVLLRLYTGKQNSPTIIIQDFSDYLQKYSRHYLQESPELVQYLDDTLSVVTRELERLEADRQVELASDSKGRRIVFVPQYCIDRIIQRYKEIDERPEIPFPLVSELHAGFPTPSLKQIHITTDFTSQGDDDSRTRTMLHQLIFPDDTAPLIYPGSISPEKMLDLAMAKIRMFLRKDESRDYIQKRMMVASPGKELTIKNQLIQFQTRPSESMRAFKHSGETFFFWSYLCSFIRQDYVKKVEKTPEETALMQSVYIAEYMNNFYKNRAQQELQRETALKNLELSFQKAPYYFDMETITRFTDSRGVPLLGQYRDTDLESFIKENTNDAGPASLPPLLVFRTETGNRYFVLKEKVVSMVVRLANEGRNIIKEKLTREWYQTLKAFDQEESMKNQHAFEKRLASLCQEYIPVLHGVVNASFIPLMAMDTTSELRDSQSGFRMFDHGRLVPYSVLLMLDRQELLTDTRIMLPFWYTIPVLSSIFALFMRPRKVRTHKESSRKISGPEERNANRETESTTGKDGDARAKRKQELKKAVAQVERRLVPEGSTLEKEMQARLDLWNRTLDPTIKNNLTEDVNSLVRDYIRRILKTIKASTFDLARIENLSETLVNSPGLIKIKNRDALLEYVELYIIQLVQNLN